MIDRGGVLISSDALLGELTNTVQKSKLASYITARNTTPTALVNRYADLIEKVEPLSIDPSAVRDSDDVIVLGTAVAGKATHIVSGDKDLLTLGQYATIPILTANDFLTAIKSSDDE